MKTGGSIKLKAKGMNLTTPLPLADTGGIVVQWVRNPGGPVQCWASSFPSPPVKNDAEKFSAKIP